MLLTRWRGARHEPTGSRRHHRVAWGFGAVFGAFVVAGATTLSLAGSAGADASMTEGSSSAQLLQITPHEGSLAVGAVFGVALAGVTGADAKAQSEGVDLGAIGTALDSYNCDANPSSLETSLVPSPLSAETGEQGAAGGMSQSPSQSDYFSNEYAMANADPYSEADTSYAGPFSDPTNAISVSGMVSKAWAGVVNGVYETGATSDIGSISLAGGAVVLKGLHWQTASPTDGGGQPSGSFSIGQVLVAGVALPVSVTDDLTTLLSTVNSVLGDLGLEIDLPTVSSVDGIEQVAPLQVQVVPNSTRDSLEDEIVNAVEPTYYEIANGLENGFSSDSSPYSGVGEAEQGNIGQELMYGVNVDGNQIPGLCDSDTPITVADVTLASLDGGGFFNVTLGGVTSSDAPLAANPFNLSLNVGNLNLAGTASIIPGTLGTPGTTGSLPTASKPATNTTTKTLRDAVRKLPTGFDAGGDLLAAGLGGLGLLLLLVEGDRRLMRRAHRAATAASKTTRGSEEA